MKKSNILIVVFAVIITAASMAGAQMADVSFNQRVPQVERSKAFTGIGTVENDLPAIPLPTAASNTETTVFRKLDGAGLQRLRKEMFNIPGLSKEFSQAISSKKVTIFYNNYGVSVVKRVGENTYAMLWESNKWLIEFLTKQETEVALGFQTKTTTTVLPSGGPIIPAGNGLNGAHDTGVGSGGFSGTSGPCDSPGNGIACPGVIPQ